MANRIPIRCKLKIKARAKPDEVNNGCPYGFSIHNRCWNCDIFSASQFGYWVGQQVVDGIQEGLIEDGTGEARAHTSTETGTHDAI